MSEQMYIFTLLVISATLLLVFGLRYLASRQAAQARTSKEDAYRDLSAKAAQAQADAIALLAGLKAEVFGVSTRLAAIEKILKDVG